MNRIQIIKTATGYNAKYIGPHSARVRELFGTDSIPTPFTSKANIFQVAEEIAQRNPGVDVFFEKGN